MTRIFHRFLCERWIPCQASTSVLWLHYRPETIHCSTKDVYTSEITFLALQSLQSTIFKIEKAPEYILQSNRLIWDLWHWFGQFAVFLCWNICKVILDCLFTWAHNAPQIIVMRIILDISRVYKSIKQN